MNILGVDHQIVETTGLKRRTAFKISICSMELFYSKNYCYKITRFLILPYLEVMFFGSKLFINLLK